MRETYNIEADEILCVMVTFNAEFKELDEEAIKEIEKLIKSRATLGHTSYRFTVEKHND